LEAVAFPEAYEKVKDLLLPNAPAILVGKVSRKKDNDELQLIVNEAIEIDPNALNKLESDDADDAESQYLVCIELPINVATDEIQTQELKTILGEYSSSDADATPVYAIVRGENGYQLVRFGKKFWVQDPLGLVDRMRGRNFDVRMQSVESSQNLT
jgi:DNA polymerase III subunit alpha